MMTLGIPNDPSRKIITDKIESAKHYVEYHKREVEAETANLKAAEQLLKIYDEAKSKEST